jgi:predicted TIM-barrel fold metal-dependent hydrolase
VRPRRTFSNAWTFGAAADWQIELWQRALDTLPAEMTLYGSDVFWPSEPEQYVEQYLRPQLGLFEVAATRSHFAPPGSDRRQEWRRKIFHDNALDHFQNATREPQRPRATDRELSTPEAHRGHGR